MIVAGPKSTYDVLDREYVYVDGHLYEFRISPTTKFIQPLSGKVSSSTEGDADKSSSIRALDLEIRSIYNVLEVISAC